MTVKLATQVVDGDATLTWPSPPLKTLMGYAQGHATAVVKPNYISAKLSHLVTANAFASHELTSSEIN